jgi:putative ABC transport system permease protein
VGIHLAQSLAIAVVAALLAPYVARWLVGLTGRVPPLSDLTGGQPLEVAQRRPLQPFLIGGAALTFVSMGLAIIPFARRRVLELRSLAARPGGKSVWQRYNLDLFAIALSLVVLFQISQRGFINFSENEARLDPLAIVFPVLLLFTGSLILLRVLPWLLRLVGWAMTKARSMSFALPGWHLGRNPIPYGRLALLVWLTTGLGAFALTYANTLERRKGRLPPRCSERPGRRATCAAARPKLWRFAPKSSPKWSSGGMTSGATRRRRSALCARRARPTWALSCRPSQPP